MSIEPLPQSTLLRQCVVCDEWGLDDHQCDPKRIAAIERGRAGAAEATHHRRALDTWLLPEERDDAKSNR